MSINWIIIIMKTINLSKKGINIGAVKKLY